MDAINRSATGLIGVFERYGMALVMLFVLDVFMPDLTPKVELMEQDLSEFTANNSGSNVLKQLFWLGMFAGYVMLHLVDRLRVLRQSFWFWMLMAWSAVLLGSMSSTYLGTSLKRAIFQFIFLFVVFSATYYAYRNRTLRLCVWITGVSVISLSLFTLAMGTGSNSLGLAGYTDSKNVLGSYISVLMIMTMVVEFIEQRKVPFNIFFKLSLLILLILTQSKTSAAVLLLVMMIARSDLLLSMLINLSMLTGFFILFVFWPAISAQLGDYWHIGQHVSPEFLTNRGLIWEACYYDLQKFGRLLTGWGYSSYFGVETIPFSFDIKWSFLQYINTSHNGYLSLLIQLGLIFSIPVYFALMGMVFHTRNLALQAALMFPIIHNLTESSFLQSQHAVWFSFIWICGVGLLVSSRTRQISIMDGVQEYRQSQQVQWRNQDALARQAAAVPKYDEAEQDDAKPLPECPENKPGSNVIVAPWTLDNSRSDNAFPTEPDESLANVVAFVRPDTDQEQPAEAEATPIDQRQTLCAHWSGVELTLVTDDIVETLDESAMATLQSTETADPFDRQTTETNTSTTHKLSPEQAQTASAILQPEELDQVANGMVSARWHGVDVMFVTDYVAQSIASSEIIPFHHTSRPGPSKSRD